MKFFRLRLMASLLLGIIAISVASSYFDVLARKRTLRHDLQVRTQWFATGLQAQLNSQLPSISASGLASLLQQLRPLPDQPGVAVYDPEGHLIATSGDVRPLATISHVLLSQPLRDGKEMSLFVRIADDQPHVQAEGNTSAAPLSATDTTAQLWLEDAFPLRNSDRPVGMLVVVADASYIRAEGMDLWKRTFIRISALVVLIVVVTIAMVRWFLVQPLLRASDWLRRLRQGNAMTAEGEKDLAYLAPIAKEITSIAEHLTHARAAAESEARLRDAGEHVWTADRLTVYARERLGRSGLFVVSNREPYMHMRLGKETECVVPPSGVVTAIEPILRACDGTWIAHGSGNADEAFVDAMDKLRVPPDDPRYTLRRVWMSDEELAGYYEGFSNEGLWPLCHIAHTRPIFRAGDWNHYQRVNARFAEAILEEMADSTSPVVLVQDYHFALLPQMIKDSRPDARVSLFWHIPWPNAETFAICPWQDQLLSGMLGADTIGFHVQAHCNNFLDTVDHVLEARTDWERFTVQRFGHISAVKTFPISVAWDESLGASEQKRGKTPHPGIGLPQLPGSYVLDFGHADSDQRLYGTTHKELGITGQQMIIGVDRLDYTKGIVERLLAIETLLDEHNSFLEKFSFVQIAAPSRSRIAVYAALGEQVRDMVVRINRRFATQRWQPILLIERQCSHAEIDRYYKAADVCVVTSLHDGMNLVAKEYVSARSDCDGVLVLSRFTGAAQELKDALIVNPYDIGQVASALQSALEMQPRERTLRMSRMRQQVREHNVYRWAANILGDLCSVRLEEESSPRPSPTKEKEIA